MDQTRVELAAAPLRTALAPNGMLARMRPAGVEPASSGVSCRCLADRPRTRIYKEDAHDARRERATRIELAWNSLEGCRLTTSASPARRAPPRIEAGLAIYKVASCTCAERSDRGYVGPMGKEVEPEFKVGDVLEPVELTSESGEVHLVELETELDNVKLDNVRLERRNRFLLRLVTASLLFFLLVLAALLAQL